MTEEEIEKYCTAFYELHWHAMRDAKTKNPIRIQVAAGVWVLAVFDSRAAAEKCLGARPENAPPWEIVDIRAEWPEDDKDTVF